MRRGHFIYLLMKMQDDQDCNHQLVFGVKYVIMNIIYQIGNMAQIISLENLSSFEKYQYHFR